jgi:hypothetical protein
MMGILHIAGMYERTQMVVLPDVVITQTGQLVCCGFE